MPLPDRSSQDVEGAQILELLAGVIRGDVTIETLRAIAVDDVRKKVANSLISWSGDDQKGLRNLAGSAVVAAMNPGEPD